MKQHKKIVLIGPESTGKTTLAKALAAHYQTIWVAEFARTYIDQLQRPYEESDLLEIATGQIALEENALQKHSSPVFFDTDLIVLKIWSLNSYGHCAVPILKQIEQRNYDLYLLCGTDIPWEYDPQREHPHLRDHFYEIYKKELQQYQKPFIEIKGDQKSRLKQAINAIDLIKK